MGALTSRFAHPPPVSIVPPVKLPKACRLREQAGAGDVSRDEGPFAGVATNDSLSLVQLSRLYGKYAGELDRLRAPARSLCATLRATDRSFCASDDVESEITYMRVREAAPARVLELAPRAGYSTFFLLAAQHATGRGGIVHSYDLEAVFRRADVSSALRQSFAGSSLPFSRLGDKHELHVGDAQLTLPARLDAGGGRPFFGYLFLDAAHTGPFGAWIGTELLVRQARLVPRGTPASIHDVFHNFLPSEEGHAALRAVRDTLGAESEAWRRLRATAFTAGKCRVGEAGWQALVRARRRALSDHAGRARPPAAAYMHMGATNNPTVFFDV
jgi:hypothetical protein